MIEITFQFSQAFGSLFRKRRLQILPHNLLSISTALVQEEIKQCEGVTEVNTSVIDIEGKPITVFEKEGRQLEGEDR